MNNAIREALPHMQQAADENPNAQILVRAIKFSSGAQWHIAQPTPIADFKWIDLEADGARDMGRAFSMLADQLKIPPMPTRALPPVLILITDGSPTDDISKGLQAIMEQPWGKKAVRLAIAIGGDADTDVLQKFINHAEIKPLQANNPETLIRYIKWNSTSVLKSVSPPVGVSSYKGEFTMSKRPGGELAARPLHFIWIADCSGSMQADGKIQALNNAIREALPQMQKVADDNPTVQVLVRALKFSSGAQWHISQPTPLADFKWIDLEADGVTDMGKAFSMLADQLKTPPMPARGLPPVLMLISDGQPTDDISKGLQAIMEQPWGKKAVRLAIAIGEDADKDVLQKFINHPEIKALQANNPEALTHYIKLGSTGPLSWLSSPPVQSDKSLPPIPVPTPTNNGTDDIW